MARPAVTVDDVIDLNCDNCARSVNGPMRGVGTGTPNSFLPDFGIHAGDQDQELNRDLRADWGGPAGG